MFPNFLCIGTQRAGTSWLYKNLKQHPDLWMPPVKEIHYFDEFQSNEENHRHNMNIFDRFFDNSSNYNKWRRSHFKSLINSGIKNGNFQDISWAFKYLTFRDDRGYACLFEPGCNKITGDITPEYSVLGKEYVAHIHEIMPNAKIIFIMRNPIQRAWSGALREIYAKAGLTLDDVSQQKLINDFLNRNINQRRSRYLQTIKTWKSYYPEEQFFMGFFEEIAECPEKFLRRLCDFLGTEASENYLNKIDKSKIHSYGNKGKIPKNIAVYLARNYYDEIKNLSRCYGGYTDGWLDYANELLEDE